MELKYYPLDIGSFCLIEDFRTGESLSTMSINSIMNDWERQCQVRFYCNIYGIMKLELKNWNDRVETKAKHSANEETWIWINIRRFLFRWIIEHSLILLIAVWLISCSTNCPQNRTAKLLFLSMIVSHCMTELTSLADGKVCLVTDLLGSLIPPK